jgi:hypothetical protein
VTCTTVKLPNGMAVIACARGPRVPVWFCATCKVIARLVCDGCDQPVCEACSVSPRTGLDYCPSCCKPYFKEWLATEEGQRFVPAARELRRAAFRAWAKNFCCLRLEAMRTKASLEVEAANNGTLNAPTRRRTR